MKITEQEMRERKDRTIRAAFELFCQKGIEKVTLAEVAQKAKVGEATIYRYFANKPQLVLQTLTVLWKSIGESLDQKTEALEEYDSMNGYEQVKVWLEDFRQLYLENSDYVLFSYESKLYLQRNGIMISGHQYDLMMEAVEEPCIAALEKGKADGSIPVEQDSLDLFYAIWGSVRGYIVKIVIYKALCGEDSPWESRYDVLRDGLLSALASGWKPPGSIPKNRD